MNCLDRTLQRLSVFVAILSALTRSSATPPPHGLPSGNAIPLSYSINTTHQFRQQGSLAESETFSLTVANFGSAPYVLPKNQSLWQINVYTESTGVRSLFWTGSTPITSPSVEPLEPQKSNTESVDVAFPLPAEIKEYQVEAEFLPTGATIRTTFDTYPLPTASVLFTGKLMGYYRLPDKQSIQSNDCEPPGSDAQPSRDAQVFIDNYEHRDPDTLLLGTGDNFSPNYYSRVFASETQPDPASPPQKELYVWGRGKWWPYDKVPSDIAANERRGNGTIPTDNVACFLSYVHYDAIVPGKEDFYYGPERLRQLARLLAGPPKPGFQSVQMLASNLVIKTSWAADHSPIPDRQKSSLGFIPLDSSKAQGSLEIEDFTDGGFVYPWLQFVRVKVRGENANAPTAPTVFLCHADKGNPDSFLAEDGKHCKYESLLKRDSGATSAAEADQSKGASSSKEQTFVYRMNDPTPLSPGENYAICIPQTSGPNVRLYCFRFSVFTPFLQFPDWPSRPGDRHSSPDLYVFKKLHGTEAVVFGVVDPGLLEHIGGDNFAWRNVRGDTDQRDKRFKTEISISDPVMALVQAEDYFEKKYNDDHPKQDFHGLRVLLAEMPPEEARELAERLPKCLRFDVIVTAADDGLATPNQSLTFDPYVFPRNPDSACHTNVGSSGLSLKDTDSLNASFATPATFIAVPPTHEKQDENGPRLVQARQLDIVKDTFGSRTYTLSGNPLPIPETEYPPSSNGANAFWLAVCYSLYPDNPDGHCDAHSPVYNAKEAAIEKLTLWVMRERWHADVALLQERDFYLRGIDEYITDHCSNSPSCPLNLQELLDRIIWKGDFLRVASVQGSVLKNILKRSKSFEQIGKLAYVPVSETGRQLIEVGIDSDPTKSVEYLINGKPLDPGALYTVATSDYIALGDTGYPDLAQPPVGRPPQPTSAPDGLVPISGVVCEDIREKLAGAAALTGTTITAKCNTKLPTKYYYDELVGRSPDDPRSGDTSWHQFYSWMPFHLPFAQPTPKEAPSPADQVSAQAEALVASAENWDVNLSKLALGFSGLSHSSSEKTLSREFGGVLNGKVNAKHFHSLDLDADSKFTSYGVKANLFLSESLQYSSNFTSEINGPASETQSRNAFAIDGGVYLHTIKPWFSKTLPQLSPVLSGHFETQAWDPITDINLNPIFPSTTSSTLTFPQHRTRLALGRLGLRWQDRKSYAEGGLEVGSTLNAIQKFNVTTSSGTTVSCLLEAMVSLTTCINNYNAANPTTPITSNSAVTTIRQPQNRYGAYWTMGLAVPINPKISYNFQDTSDYFFLSAGDNSADTRFRHQLVNTFQFFVFPNLSFNPTYSIFLFENKLDYHFLFQQQLMVQINYTFDFTNKHEWKQNFRYKRPVPSQ